MMPDADYQQETMRWAIRRNVRVRLGFQLRLDNGLRIANVEVIFSSGTQVMPIAQNRCRFLAGNFHG